MKPSALAGLVVASVLIPACQTEQPRERADGITSIHSALVVVSPGPELVALAAAVRPALVRIRSEACVFKPASRYLVGLLEGLLGMLDPHPYWEWPYRLLAFPVYLVAGPFDLTSGLGSGVFVGDGLVLTNAHVVDNAARLRCELTDGRRAEATIVALDEGRDLALLEVQGLEGERPLPVTLRTFDPSPGEPLLAMGFPSRDVLTVPILDVGRIDEAAERPNPTVTFGIVSAMAVDLGNPLTRFVQLDAALNPGSSGGPLIGLDGAMVGIATMVATDKESEGYAVPASTVLEAFSAWLRPEVAPRGAIAGATTSTDGEGRRDD